MFNLIAALIAILVIGALCLAIAAGWRALRDPHRYRVRMIAKLSNKATKAYAKGDIEMANRYDEAIQQLLEIERR